MEELKSNAEIKAGTREWVAGVRNELDTDPARLRVINSPFLEPWTLAVTIGELVSKEIRWRNYAPNPGARMRFIQAAHQNNLLAWPTPDSMLIRIRPDNLFDPPPRSDMLEVLAKYFDPAVSYGDVLKIEGGWAVAAVGVDEIPANVPGFTLRALYDEEISELPPVTQSGRKKISVASPRIDAIASKTLKPSREQVKKLLASGGVLLNWQPAAKPGYELQPGDIVAVRGGGTFRFLEISGASKKGRIFAEVEILSGP